MDNVDTSSMQRTESLPSSTQKNSDEVKEGKINLGQFLNLKNDEAE